MNRSQIRQPEFGTPPSPEAAAQNVFQEEDLEFPLIVATIPATERQRAVATGVVIFLTAAAIVLAPFAGIQVTRVDAFVPIVQTFMSAADLITAILLLAQYSIRPQTALLALASGYIFSGSFAFLQTLTFPGAYAPAGLIGDEFNTSAWLFVFWNVTFPAGILIYALLKDTKAVLPRRSARITIEITVTCVLALVALLTWMVTAKVGHLPNLYIRDVTLQTGFARQINAALGLWVGIALLVLVARRRTILDLWLMVTLLAWLPNFVVAIIASSVRFSVGWYAARCFVLISSCTLLAVLLTETTLLYSRLVSARIMQQRERANRRLSVEAVMAAISHELRTPLAAITLNASTALSQLRSSPPELEDVDDILKDIEVDSLRAGSILSSIRELLKRTADQPAPTRIEDVVGQVVRLMRHDLQINDVSIATEFQRNLPDVRLDATQLQQVLLNLVKNAIDAMGSVAPYARHLRFVASFYENSIVSLCVEDSGPGISAENRARIFDPFFTTKPEGMGLGLAICSTVIENHGGRLRLVKSDITGSIFELTLPVESNHSADQAQAAQVET